MSRQKKKRMQNQLTGLLALIFRQSLALIVVNVVEYMEIAETLKSQAGANFEPVLKDVAL